MRPRRPGCVAPGGEGASRTERRDRARGPEAGLPRGWRAGRTGASGTPATSPAARARPPPAPRSRAAAQPRGGFAVPGDPRRPGPHPSHPPSADRTGDKGGGFDAITVDFLPFSRRPLSPPGKAHVPETAFDQPPTVGRGALGAWLPIEVGDDEIGILDGSSDHVRVRDLGMVDLDMAVPCPPGKTHLPAVRIVLGPRSRPSRTAHGAISMKARASRRDRFSWGEGQPTKRLRGDRAPWRQGRAPVSAVGS